MRFAIRGSMVWFKAMDGLEIGKRADVFLIHESCLEQVSQGGPLVVEVAVDHGICDLFEMSDERAHLRPTDLQSSSDKNFGSDIRHRGVCEVSYYHFEPGIARHDLWHPLHDCCWQGVQALVNETAPEASHGGSRGGLALGMCVGGS